MQSKKTLRILLPQWQGGVNPDYVFGAEVLAFIAPPSADDETVRVAVNEDFATPLAVENGVEGEKALLAQLAETARVLEAKAPDRLIVYGGDCSISQAPFDYLSGKYGEELGVLWLDAHPDIATPETTTHLHEMVLSNVMGLGAPSFSQAMQHPVDVKRVMYAGLQDEELRPMDAGVRRLQMRVASPADLAEGAGPVLDWIKEAGIKKLAVHWDLDVISPQDFRSITSARPHMSKAEYGAAVGEMTLAQVIGLLQAADAKAEIVGLCIAEHMPWDAMNLRKGLSELSIFGG